MMVVNAAEEDTRRWTCASASGSKLEGMYTDILIILRVGDVLLLLLLLLLLLIMAWM
jgi:hypothetical protein